MWTVTPPGDAERLERWSARATLAILVGIVMEIGILIWIPHPHFWEAIATAHLQRLKPVSQRRTSAPWICSSLCKACSNR